MPTYREFHRRSLADREAFWREQAALIDWHRPYEQVLDYSRPPFARWFVGGQTNLCHNALDRHLGARAEQQALVWISTEVNQTRSFTYRELHAEVNRAAAMMQSLGVKRGDRVIIYMPMVPEAAFAILACARLGAIHSRLHQTSRDGAADAAGGPGNQGRAPLELGDVHLVRLRDADAASVAQGTRSQRRSGDGAQAGRGGRGRDTGRRSGGSAPREERSRGAESPFRRPDLGRFATASAANFRRPITRATCTRSARPSTRSRG